MIEPTEAEVAAAALAWLDAAGMRLDIAREWPRQHARSALQAAAAVRPQPVRLGKRTPTHRIAYFQFTSEAAARRWAASNHGAPLTWTVRADETVAIVDDFTKYYIQPLRWSDLAVSSTGNTDT